MGLDLDDGPDLLVELPPDQHTPTPGLQLHDVAAEVLELVRQDPGANERLQTHVARTHLPVLALAVVGPEVLLDDHGGGAHLQEAAAVVPGEGGKVK